MKRILYRAGLIAFAGACFVHLASAAPAMVAKPDPIRAQHTALFDLVRFNGGFVAVGERGVVMHSDDGGKSWQGVQTPTSRTLVSVVVIDKERAVAVGHGASIVRTTDGGRSWKAVEADEAGSDSILGITQLGDGRLVAYGAYGMYLESADQGLTWTRRKVVGDDFEWHISHVTEVGPRLFLVGEAGTIAVSQDRGETWTKLDSQYKGSFFGLLGLKDGALLAYGMRGNVFRSDDHGASWTQVPLASKSALNGGTVAEDGRVVLVGNNGLIATSRDNGRSFEISGSPEGTPIAKAAYAADGALVYVGYLATGRLAPASGAASAK